MIIGGGQEKGLRSGSENVPGIVGMRLATEIMQKEMNSEVKRFKGYRDRMIKQILEEIPDSHLNGHQGSKGQEHNFCLDRLDHH